MPWSNQNGGGGGPWGGGGSGGGNGGGRNQGPWGQGPNRPRGGGPPDLEEILRRGQDQLKNVVPGGFNGGAVVIVLLLVLGFILINSIYTVQPDERGVEMRFGKPKEEISMPGLHFHLWPFETVELVKITEQQQNIGGRSSSAGTGSPGLMLSGDQNIVNVQFSVLYSVTDPRAYIFNLESPADTLQQVSESAMREVVGRRPAEDIFRDNRQVIAEDVKTTIQATMDSYGSGISVNTVAIEDAAPPREVADAFDEVQRAEQDEDRFVEEANQYANQKLGAARGQAAQVREEAAAYKDRVVKEAEGEAQRFVSVYEQYSKAPDVTRKRLFLETMEGVMRNSKKVIMDEKNGGQGVVPYLPLNELSRPGQQAGGNQ